MSIVLVGLLAASASGNQVILTYPANSGGTGHGWIFGPNAPDAHMQETTACPGLTGCFGGNSTGRIKGNEQGAQSRFADGGNFGRIGVLNWDIPSLPMAVQSIELILYSPELKRGDWGPGDHEIYWLPGVDPTALTFNSVGGSINAAVDGYDYSGATTAAGAILMSNAGPTVLDEVQGSGPANPEVFTDTPGGVGLADFIESNQGGSITLLLSPIGGTQGWTWHGTDDCNLDNCQFDVDPALSDPPGNPADLSFAPSLVINLVPEPASLSLLGLGGLMMLRRRR